MKHTPGPWTLEKQFKVLTNIQQNTTTRVPYFEVGSDLRRLATVDSGMNDGANAQLIATAPELLEALELAQKYIRKMLADGIETALPVSNVHNYIEAIINKAKGA